ncbi:hypothetical protein HAX54_014818 [Datura stramonium]|uniref:Uncharacterized protein n=1 Tax=Datura stramonium TaxID=4076 RepID=A0ABS8RZ25_DATST|nr:hypothetical protein [Datura stramonium]
MYPPPFYMDPPHGYTEPPPQTPMMVPTQGYATPHGYTRLPPILSDLRLVPLGLLLTSLPTYLLHSLGYWVLASKEATLSLTLLLQIIQLHRNRYQQSIEDFSQTQPIDSRDMPLSQEQVERIWLDSIGGPSSYRAKMKPHELGKDKDTEYAGIKAQLDALLASGEIPPCPSDAVLPLRPPQYRLFHHQVYGQYSGLVDEPNNDKDEDEDEDEDD